MKLILKLIAGILAGIVFGLFAPDVLVQILITMKALISQLIGFTIPLLILFFVTSGIANLPKNSGKLLGRTVGLSYLSTMGAGAMAYLVASHVLPPLLHDGGEISNVARVLPPLVDLKIPPIMDVMSALTVAFVFGLGISALTVCTCAKSAMKAVTSLNCFWRKSSYLLCRSTSLACSPT